jgi:hypothetical protein
MGFSVTSCTYSSVINKVCYEARSQLLRKETITFVMSVRPSAWNNSAAAGRIFIKVYVWLFFEDLSRKFKYH